MGKPVNMVYDIVKGNVQRNILDPINRLGGDITGANALKEQTEIAKEQEARLAASQKEQEAIAKEREKEANMDLAEAQRRLLKAQRPKADLLSGTELGTQSTKKGVL